MGGMLARRAMALVLCNLMPGRNYRTVASAHGMLFEATHAATGSTSLFRVVEHSTTAKAWLMRDVHGTVQGAVWDGELWGLRATDMEAYPQTLPMDACSDKNVLARTLIESCPTPL